MAFGNSNVGLTFNVNANTAGAATAISQLAQTINVQVNQIQNNFNHLTAGGNQLSESFGKIGASITSVGTKLSLALTAPLLAIGGLGVKAALELDAVRTKMIALVGDADTANKKIAELRSLANNSVGVLQKDALNTFAQFKGIGGIADESINKIIASIGKLNAAFKIEDGEKFNRNLVQIFSKDFNTRDIREAIGQVPIFDQLLKSAFKTNDTSKLKELKESGKLTLDSFLNGLSDAVDKDPRVGNITDNLTVKLAKGFERANVALAPLGEIILNAVVPAIEKISPYIETLSNAFSSLSPTLKTIIVAVGGFLAALAPALVVIGSVITGITAIGGAITALGGLSTILPVVAGIVGVIGLLTAASFAVYEAWETNFGGIRDITKEIFDAVSSVIESAMSVISNLTQSVVADIVAFWKDNYPLIQETVSTVSEAVKNIVKGFLEVVRGFWKDYGGQITDIVSTTWNGIKGIISAGVDLIQGVVKLAMQLINGNWSGAWETFKGIITKAVEVSVRIFTTILDSSSKILKLLGTALFQYGTEALVAFGKAVTLGIAFAVEQFVKLPFTLLKLVPELIRAGMAIGAAIFEGIKQGLAGGAPAPKADNTLPNLTDTPNPNGSVNTNSPFLPPLDNQREESEKAKKEREKAEKEQLDAVEKLNTATIEQFKKGYETLDGLTRDNFENRAVTAEKFRENYLENERQFVAKLIQLTANEFDVKAGREKNPTARKAIRTDERTSIDAINDESSKRIKANEKLIADAQKESVKETQTAANKRVAIAEDEYKFTLERYEASNKQRLAEAANFATLSNQREASRIRDEQKIKEDAIRDELELTKRLALNKDLSPAKQLETKNRVAVLETSLSTQRTATSTLVTQAINKETEASDEASKKASANLSQLTVAVKKADAELKKVQNDSKREDLETRVNSSFGKARIAALRELYDFETKIAAEKHTSDAEAIEFEHNAATERVKGAINEAEQKAAIDELYKNKTKISEQDFQDQLKRIRDGVGKEITDTSAESGFFGAFTTGLTKLLEKQDGIRGFGDTLSAFGDIAVGAFEGMTNAVGNAIQQWALYGGSVGKALKQALAAELAHIAGVATVKALYATALGFLNLAEGNFAAAGHAFISAGLWAALAVGTALAGRALAGSSNQNSANSFKKESQISSGSNGEIKTTQGRSGSSNGGTAFSSGESEDKRRETTRNAPQQVVHTVNIIAKSNDSHILGVVSNNVSNRGDLHGLILRTVDG